ncbi:hypothetical protein BGY98DRAFT_1103128 [Russula aff. rugulosa BPL654]|nr:hypothetical protein BGY98DRAFT_1103128 [Russula aff. rugulosa BPL654]
MRTQDPTSRRRPSPVFPPHSLLGSMEKERHETGPSDPRKRQRNAPERHRGHLCDPQARVKRRNDRTHVRSAAKNMRKFRALCDIAELNTIPVHRHELEVAVVNGILGKAAGSRRRTTVIGRNLPQNVLPPAIKHVRRTRPKPRQHRLIPPLSSVAHVSSAHSSTKALARPVNDVATFPGCHQRDESTFADRSSSQVTALIPTLTPPDGRDNMGSLAVAASDPMFVPSTRAIHSYLVSAAGHAEIRTITYY